MSRSALAAVLVVLALALGTGCQAILGIGDTTLASDGGGGPPDAHRVDAHLTDAGPTPDTSPIPDGPVVMPDGGVVSFAITPFELQVGEHGQFSVRITALDQNSAMVDGYHGTPTLSADWGDVTVSTPTFLNGVADVAVSVNRETSPTHPAVFLTATDGAITGMSQNGIAVTAPAWTLVDNEGVFPPGLDTEWDAIISHPTWVRQNGSYLLWYYGSNENNASLPTGFGFATSPDGANWTRVGTGPVMTGAPSGWDEGWPITGFFVEPDATGLIGVYVMVHFAAWGVAHSTDGISWTRSAQGFSPGNDGSCTDAFNEPLSFFAEPGIMQVSFEEDSNPCVSESGDDGASWGNRMSLTGIDNGSFVEASAIIKDGTVYKLWYRAGSTESLLYATSTDLMTWVDSPSGTIDTLFNTVIQDDDGSLEALTIASDGGFARMHRP